MAIIAVALGLSSCGKSSPPKFEAGDHVKTVMGEEGIVAVRFRPFVDDVYYINLLGPDPALESSKAKYHESGPYDAADLRLISKRSPH